MPKSDSENLATWPWRLDSIEATVTGEGQVQWRTTEGETDTKLFGRKNDAGFGTAKIRWGGVKQDGIPSLRSLALRHPGHPNDQLAISVKYLKKNPVHADRIGEINLVVLTDESGANLVYRTGGSKFLAYDQQDEAIDSTGATWKVTERNLVATDGCTLKRLPSYRAFWFGWYASFPHTRLVKSK